MSISKEEKMVKNVVPYEKRFAASTSTKNNA